MKYREITKLVEQAGWYLKEQNGSHRQYKHPDKPGRVTIAGHPRKRRASRHAKEYSETSWSKGLVHARIFGDLRAGKRRRLGGVRSRSPRSRRCRRYTRGSRAVHPQGHCHAHRRPSRRRPTYSRSHHDSRAHRRSRLTLRHPMRLHRISLQPQRPPNRPHINPLHPHIIPVRIGMPKRRPKHIPFPIRLRPSHRKIQIRP